MKTSHILKSENGSAVVLALLILCLLTILGLSSNTTTSIDLQISANDRDYVKEFYVADSGWRTGALWLDNLPSPPDRVNSDSDPDFVNTVRNFGGSGADVTNELLPIGTQDATIDGVNYWYNVTYVQDQIEPGSGPGYRRFTYTSNSVANQTQEIEVRLSKIYKVGY